MLSNKTASKAPTRSRRQALLAGAAIAIAMTALARSPQVRAQAFQGTPTVANGSVTIIAEGQGTLLTVNTSQAVINWAPSDTATGGAPINFLPAGATATYENSTNITDFTVLNRIIPTDQTRAVQFNGTVESRVNGAAGGSVWFYSPGGIIAGAGSLFDVGNLVLTANDIDTTGGLFGDGAASQRGTIRFRGAANSQSAVQVLAGAQITAVNQNLGNAYVALVAPRIVQRGTIETVGSTALIAAEQADLTINFGNLFDINMIVGTTTGTAIDHSGTTTGPASASGSNIYLTTIAKNSAVTMLVGGTLGYTPASSATVDNLGAVILSAGYDVGIAEGSAAIASAPENANAGNITIANSVFTSNVVAHASNTLSVSPGNFGAISFSRDASLSGDTNVSFVADGSEDISVGGDLTLASASGGGGGTILFSSEFENGYGSSIVIGGDLTLDADAKGLSDASLTGIGGDANGGSALLSVTGGDVSVGGATQVLANAIPGGGGASSGSGTGGTARVLVTSGQLAVQGLVVSADAQRADETMSILGLNGGSGEGGTAELTVNGGMLSATSLNLTADGRGSLGGFVGAVSAPGGAGGDGTGGIATLAVNGGQASFINAFVSASGDAGGASGQSAGGNAAGGDVTITSAGGALSFLNLQVEADASAGGGLTGGEANGGTIILAADSSGTITASTIDLDAHAFGNFGETTGGSAFGGTITVGAAGGSLTALNLLVAADANAGNGIGEGGQAIGGTLSLSAVANGAIQVNQTTSFSASGEGGNGGQGGDGSGGIVSLLASDGAIRLGDPLDQSFQFAEISADGSGGRSFEGTPTNGAGGVITIDTQAGIFGSALIRFDNLFVSASGDVFSGGEGFALVDGPNGETPDAGSGGIGSGGEITVTLGGGAMAGNFLALNANGRGGSAGPSGPGGDGVGGIVEFLLTGGTATMNTLELSADGFGGEGFSAGDAPQAAGDGFGGEASLIASAGTLDISSVRVAADGFGGEGGFSLDTDAADGGIGYGGDALFSLEGTATVVRGFINVQARGFGGEGGTVEYFDPCGGECGYGEEDFSFDDFAGDGGAGFGGSALVELISGTINADNIAANASGFGGEGGVAFAPFDDPGGTTTGGGGGDATGGNATIRIAMDPGTGSVQAFADGFGGDGGGDSAINIGGSGGDGTGGLATLLADNSSMNFFDVDLSASGEGGQGGDGETSHGGDGGHGFGGTARLESSGEDASITIANLTLNATAFGGFGRHAGDSSTLPGQGGAGGRGGDATGGTAEIVAEFGAVTLDTFSDSNVEGGNAFITASAFAGGGGDGGDGSNPGASGGTGGNGGNGTGGTVRFSSVGGNIEAGDLGLQSNGTGGEGGFGGFGPADPGNPEAVPPIPPTDPIRAAFGAAGSGAGGLIAITARDGATPGGMTNISLGATQLEASGFDGFFSNDVAGRVQITLSSANAESAIAFQSLDVEAAGSAPLVGGGSFSFFGTLADPDGVLLFDFTTDDTSLVTLRTYSYAGGTNAAGQPVPGGGFDPILALFDSSGAVITQNDDGGANVPADPTTGSHYDTFLQSTLTPGDYRVSVTAFSNFANGPNLSDGFEGGGDFDGRTQQFAFDVLGASSASGPGSTTSSFQLSTSGPGRITVGGSANVEVGGDVRFELTGDNDAASASGFLVGGNLIVSTPGSIDVLASGPAGIEVAGLALLSGSSGIDVAHLNQGDSPTNSISANQVLLVSDGSISAETGSIIEGRQSIQLVSTAGSVNAARLLSGDEIDIRAAGDVAVGDALADGSTSEGSSSIEILAGLSAFSEGVSFVPADAIVTGTVSADNVTVRAGQDIVVESGGTISADEVLELYAFRDIRGLGSLITPGVLNIGVGGDLGMGTIDVGDAINTIDRFGVVTSPNRLSVSGDLTIAQLIRVDTGDLNLNAGGDFDIARAESNGSLFVNAGASGVIDEAIAAGSVDINAGDNTTAGSVQAGSFVDINAGDDTSVGSITAGGDVFVNAGAATSVSSITGDDVFLNAGTGLTLGTANADYVNANAGTDLTVGTIVSDDGIDLSASGNVTAEILTANYEIDVFGGGDVTIGEATTLGGVETGYGFNGSDIDVFTSGAIAIGTATSAGAIFLDGASVSADSLTADFEIEIFADGDVTIGSALTTGLGEETGYGGEFGYGSFFYNDIDITANGNINIGDADSAGNIGIEAFGTVTAASLIARGMADGDSDFEGNIGVGAEGSIDIGTANAARDLGIASLGGNVSADSLTAASDALVLAAGDIDLGSVTASGLVYLGGAELVEVIGGEGGGFDGFDDFDDFDGDDLVGTAPLSAGGAINATGLITAGDLIAGADQGITLASTDVDNDAVFVAQNGAVTVTTDLGVGGIVRAFGAGIDFTSLGALTIDEAIATDGDIDVVATQRLTVDDLESAGDIRLTSTADSVFLTNVTTQQPVFEEAGQRAAAFRPLGEGSGNPGPGDIIINAAIDIVAEGAVDARRNLSMDAGNNIVINDDAHGVAIDLRSADIRIDDELGQLGRSTTTTSIRFENIASGSRTFIGGTDDDVAGYQLRANELNRVFSNGDIAIVGSGGTGETGTQPNVVIGTMTIRGQTGTGQTAGQIANGGRFSVDTAGRLAIVGDVDFVGINNDARVAFDADQQISLAAETGSVSLRGAGAALAGELQLNSNMVIAGTADAIADVAAATSTDAISDRLGQSEGTANNDGFFAARGIRVQASNGFFVQNSGASAGTTPADRRGLTVGEGGLRVQTNGTSTRIVINGRQMNADGSFASGVDLISRVQFTSNSEQSTALFDPRSTINGCLIAGGAACGAPPPPPPPPPVIDPTASVRDVLDLIEEEGLSPGSDPGEASAFPTALVTFADFESFGFEPLIDEPVTGAGNDDFWIGDDEDDEDEDEDEDEEE